MTTEKVLENDERDENRTENVKEGKQLILGKQFYVTPSLSNLL